MLIGIDLSINRIGGNNSTLAQLMAFGGLTFYKDYATSQVSANADYSTGSATVTVTAARSATAPATYIDSSGVIQTTTTANVPRWTQGFYDSTGFHSRPGLLVENTVTNRALQSSVFTNASWTKTNMTAVDSVVLSGSPMATVSTLTATSTDATLTQAFTDAVAGIYTASIFVRRKTGTGTISLRANTLDAYTDLTSSVSSSFWTRIQVQSSSATNPTFDLKISTSGDELYVVAADLVKLAYMTSHIPITTVARARAAETISYVTSGNRTASEETIFVKHTSLGRNWVNDNIQRTLTSTSTKERTMVKSNTGSSLRSSPNATDNSGVVAIGASSPVAGTSYVFTGAFQHDLPNPYATSSLAGDQDGTYTAGDWTDPAWGANFYVGVASAGNNQCNGIIEAIAIFSNFKEVPDINHISYLLDRSVVYKSYLFTPSTSSASNLVSGSAGTGNVITNPLNYYLWMDSYVCTDSGWLGSSNRTGETWLCFMEEGSDAERNAPPAVQPVGDIVFRTYTKSTNTMGTGVTTAWTDATYQANEILAYRVPSESFVRIYFSMATRATPLVNLGIYCIKSTDLTCASWGSPVQCISGDIRQPWCFVDLEGGSKALVCGETGAALGGKVTLFSTSDFDTFTQYSQISGTSSTNGEGGVVGDGNGRMIAIMRKNTGDFLLQSVSSDWGLTWSSIFSTGLGASTGAKVKPRLKIAAGYHDRIMPYFYDRGDNRLKIGTPTKFDDAYLGTWLSTYLIGTSAQGNGGFEVIDETLLQYIVSNQSGTEPTNDFRWWKFKDIYSWVAQ